MMPFGIITCIVTYKEIKVRINIKFRRRIPVERQRKGHIYAEEGGAFHSSDKVLYQVG